MPEIEILSNYLTKKQASHSKIRTNRGRIEIIGDILSLCTVGGMKKTHIMYKGNLSYTMLQLYLEELESLAFLELSEEKEYRTTEKGRSFLMDYWHIRELMGEPIQWYPVMR